MSSTKRHSRHASRDSAGEDTNTSLSENTSKKRSSGPMKLFKKKKSKTDDSPPPHRRKGHDDDSASGSASDDGSSVEVPYAAHMDGSRFRPSDICPSCDAPRGDVAVCPISHYHHGTDELMPVESTKKKGLLGKLRRHSRTTSGVAAQSTSSLPPLAPDSGSAKKKMKAAAKSRADTTAAAAESSEEAAAVQYYTYTDAEGNTYYYAAPPADEDAEATTAATTTTAAAGATSAASASNATPIAHEAQPVCYQYVDEDGTTKYYYAYPETNNTDADASAEPVDAEETTTAAAHGLHSHGRHSEKTPRPAERDPASNPADGDSESRHSDDKHQSRRGSRIKAFFTKKRGSRANLSNDDDASDSRSRRASSSSSMEEERKHKKDDKKTSKSRKDKDESAKKKKSRDKSHKKKRDKDMSSEASVSGPSGEEDSDVSEYQGHTPPHPTRSTPASASALDAAIAARAREIERAGGPEARKRFEKDLRKAVKELEETEKSERHQLSRQRRVFTEDLGRQKRAIAFEMRGTEKRVNQAIKRGEPQ